MDYNSIRPYNIKSHLELQREITLIELAPSPYFLVQSICLVYMNMFARFNENPAMIFKILRKQNIKDGRMDRCKHRLRENSIPTTNKVCGGYNKHNIKGRVLFIPLCTNGFFHPVRDNKLGLVHCIYRGVTGFKFPNKIVFLSLKILFV